MSNNQLIEKNKNLHNDNGLNIPLSLEVSEEKGEPNLTVPIAPNRINEEEEVAGDNKAKKRSDTVAWVLPFATYVSIAILLIVLVIGFGRSMSPQASLPALASVITASISALLWVVSANLPEQYSRKMNAAAGGYTAVSVIFGAANLPGLPKLWTIIAVSLGFVLLLVTVATSIINSKK